MTYLARALDLQLNELLPYVGAIAIDGPKGVGKTSTAEQRATTTLHLDREQDRIILRANPAFDHFPDGSILIDEWQRVPEVWDIVRRAVDDGCDPGRFLLTGSATPIAGTTTHSGAGRVLSLRMRPMAVFERGSREDLISLKEILAGSATITGQTDQTSADYAHSIATTGLPGLQNLPPLVQKQHIASYIDRILDRDLPDQGYTTRNKAALLAWMRAYAAATATQASYSKILDSATPGESNKPSKKSSATYRDKLSEIWILDPLPAWNFASAPFPRVSQQATHFLADPGLALHLLGLTERSLQAPRNAHIFGCLFEALAVLCIRVGAEANFATVGHFRTRNGDHEIDAVIEGADGGIVPVEVKLTHTPSPEDGKHLLWLRNKLPEEVVDMIIITTGDRAYRREDGIACIPLSLFGV